MTRTTLLSRATAWLLPALAAALFLLLCAAFGTGQLVGPLWNSARWVDSPLITYVLLGAIVAAGIVQVNRLPTNGCDLPIPRDVPIPGQTASSFIPTLVRGDVFWAVLALPLRIFVGRMWLSAGLGKLTNPAWTDTGQALHGFWQNAVAVNEAGQGKITYDWYRRLLLSMDAHHWYGWFAKLIVAGELLVGLALLLGGLVGIAAFCGAFLNLNYGLAGAASANPILLVLGLLLVVTWRTAGYWGIDRWLLPLAGPQYQRRREFPDRRHGGLVPALKR
jgi:thiosulfate dehydrogenase [quinone] large subunit